MTVEATKTKCDSTEAGRQKFEYSRAEKGWAALTCFYLTLCLVGGLWFELDILADRLTLARLSRPIVTDLISRVGLESPPAIAVSIEVRSRLALVLLVMGAGWVGGTLSAMRSLQSHYGIPVDFPWDEAKQEKDRFYTAYLPRYFWGPWLGTGLALVVFALVRSGVLVFGGLPGNGNDGVTFTVQLANMGLGALVGLAAKDVIEKLVLVIKDRLQVEEMPVKDLIIAPPNGQETNYGGALCFQVQPKIAVIWALDPSDPKEAGTIVNGIFRAVAEKPAGVPDERHIVVTATSVADPARSASTTFLLKKKT
jgi:hypothetical protein